MKIVISGLSDKNKGAELMMYAIIQAFEARFPGSIFYLPAGAIRRPGGITSLHTKADVRYKPDADRVNRWKKYKISGALGKLHINFFYFDDVHPVKGADYFLDASGFSYSDQWDINRTRIEKLKYQLRAYKKQGTKICFLPQAFGPVAKENTKKIIQIIGRYADIVMPREPVSLQYVKDVLGNAPTIKMHTDFTSLVDGLFPTQYEHLRNGICIIPSNNMFSKGIMNKETYVELIKQIIKLADTDDRPVYLLSHEDGKDQLLVKELSEMTGSKITPVVDLTALEVKELIASAYFCITSRFHGAASALNSCVPCLATSWSHKYKELFSDYGIEDAVISVNNIDEAVGRIKAGLTQTNIKNYKEKLQAAIPQIKKNTQEMWNSVYSL